ncbi:uncharacterized protein LOC120347490 [Styela clava]
MGCVFSCLRTKREDCIDGAYDGPVEVVVKVTQTHEIVYPSTNSGRIRVKTLHTPKTWTKLKCETGGFILRHHHCGKDYYMTKTSKEKVKLLEGARNSESTAFELYDDPESKRLMRHVHSGKFIALTENRRLILIEEERLAEGIQVYVTDEA